MGILDPGTPALAPSLPLVLPDPPADAVAGCGGLETPWRLRWGETPRLRRPETPEEVPEGAIAGRADNRRAVDPTKERLLAEEVSGGEVW